MPWITTEELRDIIQQAGHDSRSYSGRGMYGKSCVGVVVEEVMPAIADLVLGCEDTEQAYLLIDRVKSDNMGCDTILYWPSVEWSEKTE
jgi:hypothetical protein